MERRFRDGLPLPPFTMMTLRRSSALLLGVLIVILALGIRSACSRKPVAMVEPLQPGEVVINNQSDKKGLLLSWQHPVSHRHAVLEELDGMAWLYLTNPGKLDPKRDCPAFATRPLTVEKVDMNAVSKLGAPPPISKDVASPEAVITGVVPGNLNTVWSEDGESVGLLYKGRIIAMIVSSATQGHSRALELASPFGLPFDEGLANLVFGVGAVTEK